MSKVDRERDTSSIPIDHLIIQLRAYVTRAPERPKTGKTGEKAKSQKGDFHFHEMRKTPASDWALIFDCETHTTPDQRLRFGGYQLRYKGKLWERGAFFEPKFMTKAEAALLRKFIAREQPSDDGERIRLLTRSEFVEQVFYKSAYEVGAQIVGFNLPFDLSRLAIRHASARRSMRGGFSLTLSAKAGRPAVAVKHLSQRSSLIRFSSAKKEKEASAPEDIDPEAPHESEAARSQDNGYFTDVKTFAGALLSGSHSLASLSALLQAKTPKLETEEHGGTSDRRLYPLRSRRRPNDLGML